MVEIGTLLIFLAGSLAYLSKKGFVLANSGDSEFVQGFGLIVCVIAGAFSSFFFITIGMMGVSSIYYIIPQEIRFAFASLFAVIPIIGIASAFNTAHSNKLAKTALFAVFILFIGFLAWHR